MMALLFHTSVSYIFHFCPTHHWLVLYENLGVYHRKASAETSMNLLLVNCRYGQPWRLMTHLTLLTNPPFLLIKQQASFIIADLLRCKNGKSLIKTVTCMF